MMKNNKNLGQHWLKNRAILDEIADLALPDAPPSPSEPVLSPLCLEIGPGLGTLTSSLLRRFPRVLAIEYDQHLAENLPKSFPGTNLQVKNADFLQFDLKNISQPYVVAGNIPYYITSPIITKLLTTPNPPLKIVLLIQKEVATRILSGPGRHTYLSIFAQNFATVTPGPDVPRQYFTPPPKVDSAVVVFRPHPPLLTPDQLNFVKQGFKNPRKKLIKNLPINRELLTAIFANLGLNPDVRPSDLSISDWQNLQTSVASPSSHEK